MATSINRKISSWQQELYPNTSTGTIWSSSARASMRKHSLIGKVALLPMACAEAVLEVVKRVTSAISYLFTALIITLKSPFDYDSTVKESFIELEDAMKNVAMIPMLPARFAWQLICILKDNPAYVLPLSNYHY